MLPVNAESRPISRGLPSQTTALSSVRTITCAGHPALLTEFPDGRRHVSASRVALAGKIGLAANRWDPASADRAFAEAIFFA